MNTTDMKRITPLQMDNIKSFLKSDNSLCLRGSYARGDSDRFSDIDFLLLQREKDDNELNNIIIILKNTYQDISVIRYSLFEEDNNNDMLKLQSLNSMVLVYGNNQLFNDFKNKLFLTISNMTFLDLFSLLDNDSFSQYDIGQYYNLKNGAFSTLRLEFCDLLNAKQSNIIFTKFYREFHIFMRHKINHYFNCNVENSKRFEDLVSFKRIKISIIILKLILYRIIFSLHLFYIRNKLIIKEYDKISRIFKKN